MNKRGEILHWVGFAILGAIAAFLLVTVRIDPGLGLQGGWQIAVLETAQDAQIQQLTLDRAVQAEIKKTVKEAELTTTCGTHKTITLLNSQGNYCTPKIDFLAPLKKKFSNYSFTEEKEMIVGKKDVSVTKRKHQLPQRIRSVGTVSQFKEVPFYLNYSTELSFIAKKPLVTRLLEGKPLVERCRDETNLRQCLDQFKNDDWLYSSCQNPQYIADNRKVIFCFKPLEKQVALDFTPTTQ